MNKLLKEKLIKIQRDMEAERRELKAVFLGISRKPHLSAKELLAEYDNEQRLLIKYGLNRNTMIEYIVAVDFALSDLYLILNWR